MKALRSWLFVGCSVGPVCSATIVIIFVMMIKCFVEDAVGAWKGLGTKVHSNNYPNGLKVSTDVPLKICIIDYFKHMGQMLVFFNQLS